MRQDIAGENGSNGKGSSRNERETPQGRGTQSTVTSVQPDAQQKQEYEQYVKSVTPTHNLWAQMGKAFLTGGIICCIGQGILNYTGNVLGMDPQTSGSWCSLILVFLSVVLTALHIYPKIAKWGGAGALVPITGFANSVTAPAVEYRKEGQVFGIGCKIFTIAGPVILYGIFASWLLGLICWVLQLLGIGIGSIG